MKRILSGLIALVIMSPAVNLRAQQTAPTPPPSVEEIGDRLYRIGNVFVDLEARQVEVAGVVNDVTILEFVANTLGGFKAYESAVELQTDAISFNLGMVLVGLDNTHAVLPKMHFDPDPPQGDPVRIWIEWNDNGQTRRIRCEELIYNEEQERTLPESDWVYTGSVFLPDGSYLAEADGVLIGFVHTPAPIIENPLPDGVGNYGAWILNPTIGLDPGTEIKLIVEVVD
jgi:hypothetical protein